MPSQYKRKDGRTSVYEKSGRKRGRPTLFSKEIKAHALTLAAIGLTNMQIARELLIPETTFKTWLKRISDFSSDLDGSRNKLLLDAKRCLSTAIEGYRYTEKKIIHIQNAQGRLLKKKIELNETYSSPNVQATMYVLDRRSKYFRRRPTELDKTSDDDCLTIVVEKGSEL